MKINPTKNNEKIEWVTRKRCYSAIFEELCGANKLNDEFYVGSINIDTKSLPRED